MLPGGNAGAYFITPGLSAWLLRKMRIEEAEFVRLVRESDDEAALCEELASRIDETLRDKMNRYVDCVRVGELSPENQDIVRRNHPWAFPDEMLLSEVLEEDDRRLFPLSDTV